MAGNLPGAGRQYDAANRLIEDAEHTYTYDARGKVDPSTRVDVNPMPGSNKLDREIAEHQRIQQNTGYVPARQSDAVSKRRDPIGPRRQQQLSQQGRL